MGASTQLALAEDGLADTPFVGALFEGDGQGCQAFEEPPDEADLLEAGGFDIEEASRQQAANSGVCAEVDRSIRKFLSQRDEPELGSKSSKGDMERWVEDYNSVVRMEEEPGITELQGLTLGFAEEATIRDPWMEAHSREAAVKARKWAEASRAHRQAQAKRKEESKAAASVNLDVKYAAGPRCPPPKQSLLPEYPLVEEEVEKASCEHGAGSGSGRTKWHSVGEVRAAGVSSEVSSMEC